MDSFLGQRKKTAWNQKALCISDPVTPLGSSKNRFFLNHKLYYSIRWAQWSLPPVAFCGTPSLWPSAGPSELLSTDVTEMVRVSSEVRFQGELDFCLAPSCSPHCGSQTSRCELPYRWPNVTRSRGRPTGSEELRSAGQRPWGVPTWARNQSLWIEPSAKTLALADCDGSQSWAEEPS